MAMQLHTETTGRGPDLFLLHGWVLNSRVWDSVLPALAAGWRVTCVDLPGHGRSHAVPLAASLQDTARLVVQAAPETAVWLGWSFGGLVALRAALDFPAGVRALILVSSTPRFPGAPDWPYGTPPLQLEKLAVELQHDYRDTVRKFLALQVQGTERAGDLLRRLRALLLAAGEPDAASLGTGLEILRHSDLRAEIGRLDLPVLVMTGGRDRLVLPQAGRAMAAMIKGAERVQFPHAAHAPFLSHPQEFTVALRQFLGGLPGAAAASAEEESARG